LAVVPASQRFVHNRIVAFQNVAGWVVALGLAVGGSTREREWTVLTPLESLEGVDTLRLGDVTVDPGSWEDRLLR
jgi:hypothetical protein